MLPQWVKSVLVLVCGCSFLVVIGAYAIRPELPWQLAVAGATISLGTLRFVRVSCPQSWRVIP